jgi:hypothetical protein
MTCGDQPISVAVRVDTFYYSEVTTEGSHLGGEQGLIYASGTRASKARRTDRYNSPSQISIAAPGFGKKEKVPFHFIVLLRVNTSGLHYSCLSSHLLCVQVEEDPNRLSFVIIPLIIIRYV